MFIKITDRIAVNSLYVMTLSIEHIEDANGKKYFIFVEVRNHKDYNIPCESEEAALKLQASLSEKLNSYPFVPFLESEEQKTPKSDTSSDSMVSMSDSISRGLGLCPV